MPFVVTLHPPDETGAWRIQLSDPPPTLPHAFFVALDGRPYPFHTPPLTLPTHPINLLWRGTAGRSQAILAAVRSVAAGARPVPDAEAVIAEHLMAWAQQWARVQTRSQYRRNR